jgi:glucan phosphoethanolaminetransferase (alkaline phosphatase superfamily)
MKILKNFKNNLILTVLFFGSVAISHKIYAVMRMGGVDSVKLDKYIGLFLILFIFSFIRQNLWRYLAMGFLLILSFGQFVHLEFYGVPVFPAEMYLLFSQAGEIAGTLTEDYSVFYLPVMIALIPAIILFFINKRLPPKVSNRYVFILFVFYFIYNPARTFVTGNTWGRQPSAEEFEGTNIYLSTSYFLGRILPAKLTTKQYDENYSSLKFTKTKELDHNVIFVLGESLTPNHMSLFGYKRETTPFLDSLKKDEGFYYSSAISSGVSSDVSIAFLMNNTFGPNATKDVYSGKSCLFNLAKQAGFSTYYYSTQSQQQLRYIANSLCPKFVDDYKFLEGLSPSEPDHDAASDMHLITHLKKLKLDQGKKFIVLHQRGSHAPYNKRFSDKSNKFNSDKNDRSSVNTNYYDNSVYEFDRFMNELITYVSYLDKPTHIIYVSDHGEGLGEEGVHGHGKLNRISYQVPFLYYSNKGFKFDFPEKLTHLNISLFTSKLLGFESQTKALEQQSNYIVFGNDMDGFMGWMKVNLQNKQIEVEKVFP